MGLQHMLLRIANEYPHAAHSVFTGHPLAQFIRQEATAIAKAPLAKVFPEFSAQGSPGLSRWSDSPWLALMDPLVTTTPQAGYYVAYLFPSSMRRVYLSLQLGTKAIRDREPNAVSARKQLDSLTGLIRNTVPEFQDRFTTDIDLEPSSPSSRAAFYEHAHAFGTRYEITRLPGDEQLESDLQAIAVLYRSLTFRGGDRVGAFTVDEQSQADNGVLEREWEDPSKRRFHQRVERNRKLVALAKKVHGYSCQACDFSSEVVYGRKYIEAHHIVPLHELKAAGRVRLDPARDFAVLCPNCHAMIHQKNMPHTIQELRQLVMSRRRYMADQGVQAVWLPPASP